MSFTGRGPPGYREDDPDLLLAIALSKSLMVRARQRSPDHTRAQRGKMRAHR